MAAESKRLVLFGAGMTGRGQVAQLACEDGWSLTLVDRNAELVERLRRAGCYTVRLLSQRSREVVVRGFDVLHSSESAALVEAIRQADFVVTSVLEPNLPDVGRVLAPALAARLAAGVDRPLNVVAAENMNNSSSMLRRYTRESLRMPADALAVFERAIGFPDSMVARVVPVSEDPLFIVTEEYSEWTADRDAAVGEPPALAGLEWISNQTARLQRKLYIHNTGHAVCAYLGWLAGYRYIHESAQDAQIMGRLSDAISDSGEAVTRVHGFDRAVVRAYEQNLKDRLVISALPDDLRRVIRQPIRKLGQQERLVGPLLLCEKFDLPSAGLCYGVAALLAACLAPRSRALGDEQFDRVREVVARAGPLQALAELVDYQPGEGVAAQIAGAYQSIQSVYGIA